jgi:hypothetical protein
MSTNANLYSTLIQGMNQRTRCEGQNVRGHIFHTSVPLSHRNSTYRWILVGLASPPSRRKCRGCDSRLKVYNSTNFISADNQQFFKSKTMIALDLKFSRLRVSIFCCPLFNIQLLVFFYTLKISHARPPAPILITTHLNNTPQEPCFSHF